MGVAVTGTDLGALLEAGPASARLIAGDASARPVRQVRLILSFDRPPASPGTLWVLALVDSLLSPRLDGLILELSRQGAAGLVLPFGQVPESTRMLADRLGLALIAVPPEELDGAIERWRDVVDRRHLAELARVAALKTTLLDAWLTSPSLEAYMEAAGGLVHGRVAFAAPDDAAPPAPATRRHSADVPWGKGLGSALMVDLPAELDDPVAADLVRHLASLVAMRIDREVAPIESDLRLRGELLLELLVSESPGGSAIRAAQRFGLDLGRKHFVVLWDLDDFTAVARRPEMSEARILRLKQDVVERLERGARQRHRRVWVLPHSDEFVLVVESEGRDSDAATARRTIASLQADLGPTLARYGVRGISAGVGFAYPGSGGLRKSFEEAREALLVGLAQFGHASVTHFHDLGIHRFLYGWVESPRSRLLATDFLRPLLGTEGRGKAQLLRTLRVYLEARGKSAAAQELGIHRNSLEYRLSRIEDLLRVDLDDPSVLLVLQLLMRALPEGDKAHEN